MKKTGFSILILCLATTLLTAQPPKPRKDKYPKEEKTMSLEAFQKKMHFPLGAPNDAYAAYFSGRSWLAPLGNENMNIANVTFEPGCRNNWHIHEAEKGGGQMLLCVAGKGWYQEWGKKAVALKAGDSVMIPANVKHWHGAASDSWFAHLAISVPGEQTGTQWLEPVSDADYAALGTNK